MSIESVDMDRALSSASYAQQVLRSGNVSTEQKGQLAAKWGTENVNKWLSVDSTNYEIDDVDYDSAKEAGKEATKDSVGYDGGKSGRAVVDAVESVGATVVGQTVGKYAVNAGAKLIGASKNIAQDTLALHTKGGKATKLSDIATAILTSAVAAKYYIAKPNKEQLDAAMQLMKNDLPEGQAALCDAQDNIADASEEITELTEEAETINEDANEKIEEDKTMFDFYKQQYDALKAKKESGGQLTPDEKALMKELAPMMEDMSENITATSEETSDQVNDLNDEIGEYQDVFDDSAETIAEVEGVTDFAEGFDENTRTMMYVEAAAQGVNAVSAGIAAAKLWAKAGLTFGATSAFAAMASAAAIASTKATTQQIGWAGEMSDEIHARREVQELGGQTNDIYEEELDNYAGNIETVEDLELEIPEEMEMPEEQGGADASMMSIAAQNSENEQEQTTPMGTQKQDESPKATNNSKTNGTDKNDKENNNKKKIEE